MRVQHVTQTARSWPRGTKEDLQHGDLLAKKIDRIRWRLWHGRPQGALDLIAEILEELEMPKRQIQLTAVYIKKLTGVLRDLETYVSGQFNSIINYAAARRSGEPISTAQTESAVHRLLHRRMTAKQQMRWYPAHQAGARQKTFYKCPSSRASRRMGSASKSVADLIRSAASVSPAL